MMENKYLVIREKNNEADNCIVTIMYNRNNGKYQFVNLTNPHICACVFDSVDDALADMQQKVVSKEIVGYVPLVDKEPADYKFFVPKTHHPLVSIIPNVITCEDYCKWYDLYYIDDNHDIYTLDHLYSDARDIDYRDHSWRPRSIVEFALKHNLKIGEMSYFVMVAMWAEAIERKVDNYDLPTYEDYMKVIVPDHGTWYKCFFNECDLLHVRLYRKKG